METRSIRNRLENTDPLEEYKAIKRNFNSHWDSRLLPLFEKKLKQLIQEQLSTTRVDFLMENGKCNNVQFLDLTPEFEAKYFDKRIEVHDIQSFVTYINRQITLLGIPQDKLACSLKQKERKAYLLNLLNTNTAVNHPDKIENEYRQDIFNRLIKDSQICEQEIYEDWK